MRRLSTSRSVLSSAPSATYCRGLGFASRAPLLSSTTTSTTHSNVFGSHVETTARNWETTTLISKSLYSTSTTTPTSTTSTQTLPYEAIPEVQFPEIMELGGFTKGLYLLKGLNKRYGDLVRANIGGVNVAWVFNPDDIQNVMQHEGKYPQGAATTVWPFVQAFASRGITMLGLATGETWKRLRTAFQKNIFPPGDADTYMPLVTPVVDEALEVIQKNQDKLDVLLPSMTFEMIAAVLFGQSLGAMKGTAAPEDYEYIRCVFTLFESCEELLHKDPTKVTPEETAPFFNSFDYLMKRGAYHTKLTLEKHKNGTLNSPVPPYLSKSSEIPDVTVEEITNNVLGLLIAGVDTTANTIQWFLYNLARSPDAQEKLAAEVRSVLKGRSLTKEDLNDLPYLKAALKENFRVSPTIPGTARILNENITLAGKYSCPPGTIFFLSPYGVCMNPAVYENPDAFIPDRWDRKSKGERKENNPWHDSVWVHMPFSRGPRMCMGSRLAELEVFAFITGFVQKFKIEFAPDSPASEPISKLTIRPLPAPKFIITPRK